MNVIAHEKLEGLDRDRILAVVEPILRAHNVEGVELRWRTDRSGWVLQLTVERPGTRVPGMGITVDLCADISRDLSAALDVADVIPQRYSLEVGSPGLERGLYKESDYERFAGQLAKLKLHSAVDNERTLRGTLHGLDDQGRVLIETERGEISVAFDNIDRAQLLFDWAGAEPRAGKPNGSKPDGSRRSSGHGKRSRRPPRSR